jgi:hypothetical protein
MTAEIFNIRDYKPKPRSDERTLEQQAIEIMNVALIGNSHENALADQIIGGPNTFFAGEGEPMVGGYMADYSPISPEDIAKEDDGLTELYRNSSLYIAPESDPA